MVKQKPGFFSKLFNVFRLDEDSALEQTQSSNIRSIEIQYDPRGTSGIENYGGYYYEDYLRNLAGHERADFFDKMKRSDPKIKMLLSAVKNPIKAASWNIEPADDSDLQKQIAEIIELILFSEMDKSWTAFIHETLTMIEQGSSWFEIVDKIIIGHRKYGNVNALKSLAFRSQRTLHRFNLCPQTGKLKSISQYAYGDLQRLVDLPAEYLLGFVMDKEGDNYEGISWLRPCIGAFKRKEHHLKLEAIGIEKYAIPTPILTVPEGKETSPEYSVAVNVMKKYITHEQQFITKPSDWGIDFLKNDGFDASKIRASIDKENTEMVNAFLANFLDLGQSGSGSYALSFDLSDFFLSSIEHIALLICEEINRCLIPRMVKLNFGPQQEYPRLTVSGITDKAGKEFSEIMKNLIEAKVIIPDDRLEESIRDRYGLPYKSEEGQRQVQPPQQGFAKSQQVPMAEKQTKSILSLEEPKKQIKTDREVLLDYMKENLSKISDNMIQQVIGKYRNLPDSRRLDAIKNISPKGQQEYLSGIIDLLAGSSYRALQQARKEVPKKRKIRLTEHMDSMKLSEFDSLPPDVQKKLKARAQLLVDSQMGDLEKAIYFQYANSVDATDSEALLVKDLASSAKDYVEGINVQGAAGSVIPAIVNEARNAFFFDSEVESEIESYTFVNGDPVSPICQALAGTVFAKDDPQLQEYWPPLHFNCKSYLSPNLVGKNNPSVTEQDDSWNKDVGAAKNSINLEESSFAVQSVLVSKDLAKSTEEAKALVKNYVPDPSNAEELETGYKFINKDASLFQDGSLKSFCPIEGITVYLGNLKPLTLAEDYKLQTVIVSKEFAKTVAEARKIAKEVGAQNLDKYDETNESYRFRQHDPSGFVESSFRTKAIPKIGVSLVYGKIK